MPSRPRSATARLSLVDRGFVYAIAHIRGGTDKGWHWYQDGKLAKKPNTFTDFIAAAEHLRRDRLRGAGQHRRAWRLGRRPADGRRSRTCGRDLFAGIIAEVPFVDVLNTMLDDTLPLTPPEWPEWGNPIADAQAFRTMLGYSPYDNVRAQDYPAMLALAGLTDPRVTYWEPAKWVAKLRALEHRRAVCSRSRTNMEAGHGGAAGPLRPAEGSGAVAMPSRSMSRDAASAGRSSAIAAVRYFCSSSIVANLTVPCGSSASIAPSMNSV